MAELRLKENFDPAAPTAGADQGGATNKRPSSQYEMHNGSSRKSPAPIGWLGNWHLRNGHTLASVAEKLESRNANYVVLPAAVGDGPALLLREAVRDPARAAAIAQALEWNGGARNAAGVGLAAVDWEGRVRPDQFWSGPVLGTVTERPLSRIWSDPPAPLRALRRRSDTIGGRCTACRFRAMCGGGLASRALAATGRLDAPDPACHLSDDEIALAQ